MFKFIFVQFIMISVGLYCANKSLFTVLLHAEIVVISIFLALVSCSVFYNINIILGVALCFLVLSVFELALAFILLLLK